jgi:ribonuclease P protein component
MLSKKERLTKNKEFEKVWQRGRSSFDGLLGVKAVPNNLGCNRFGILVGLKVGKKAVERNKVKRRIREAIKSFSLELKKGFDIVVISLPAAKEKKQEVFKESLAGSFKKLRLLI